MVEKLPVGPPALMVMRLIQPLGLRLDVPANKAWLVGELAIEHRGVWWFEIGVEALDSTGTQKMIFETIWRWSFLGSMLLQFEVGFLLVFVGKSTVTGLARIIVVIIRKLHQSSNAQPFTNCQSNGGSFAGPIEPKVS